MIVLACVGSIPAGKLDLHDVRTAAGRGEFLVPVLIMLAETVRRWTREVACPNRFWRGGQITACIVSAFLACICFAATVLAAVDRVTAASSRSIDAITFVSLAVALIFGTVAVSARAA